MYDENQKEFQKIIALLLVDVANSTKLQETLGVPMYSRSLLDLMTKISAIIKAHNHRGHVVKSTGDGILAYFDSTCRAVECGLAASRSVSSSEKLQIRIAIDMGAVKLVIRGNKVTDIQGITVHRLFRLEPLGSRGRIITSKPVWENSRLCLKEQGVSWHDHGYWRLKGFTYPERVFEAYHEESTRPLKTLNGSRAEIDDIIMPCRICGQATRLADSGRCSICNQHPICTAHCFDERQGKCPTCYSNRPEEKRPDFDDDGASLKEAINAFQLGQMRLVNRDISDKDWLSEFDDLSEKLLQLARDYPDKVTHIYETAQAFESAIESIYERLSKEARHFVRQRLKEISTDIHNPLDLAEFEHVIDGMGISSDEAVELILSQDQLDQEQGLRFLMRNGFRETMDILEKSASMDTLNSILEIIWKHMPEILLTYDEHTFKDAYLTLMHYNPDKWKELLFIAVSSLKKQERCLETMRKAMNCNDENLEVMWQFFAVSPTLELRKYGLQNLSLERVWPIAISKKAPWSYVADMVHVASEKAKKLKEEGKDTDAFIKPMFLVLKGRLKSSDTVHHLEVAYRIMKVFYHHPAFLEEYFFSQLVECHIILKERVTKWTETASLEEKLVHEFKQFISKDRFPDIDIQEMPHVPLPIQRKLARDGFAPEMFICNNRDPIALEAVPYVARNQDMERILRDPKINRTALNRLMNNIRQDASPRILEIFCNSPKASPQLINRHIMRLPVRQLEKLKRNKNATNHAREAAAKILAHKRN